LSVQNVLTDEGLNKKPTAGSFVRPTRKADPPRSFVEALKAKYASDDLEGHVRHQPIRISGKEAEEVGFDKIRKQLAELHELRIIILDGLCMSRPLVRAVKSEPWPERLTDVKDVCPKATELDLSRNLFEEWREVASICEQLDKLRSLRAESVHNSRRGKVSDHPQRQPFSRYKLVRSGEAEVFESLCMDSNTKSGKHAFVVGAGKVGVIS
jgi:hypothetical protein